MAMYQFNLRGHFIIFLYQGDVHFDPENKGDIYLPFVRSTYNRFGSLHVLSFILTTVLARFICSLSLIKQVLFDLRVFS